MKTKELTNCPICGSSSINNILTLNCGTFDNSTLYQNIRINSCNGCGHIFNKLSSAEIKGLIKYYNDEYAPTNMGAIDCVGDRPGSQNYFTMKRYDQLFCLIGDILNKNAHILDVGCAMGGFLDYLYRKGFANLYGIDLVQKYVNYANYTGKYTVKLGDAESIPFSEGTFDLLIMDQVLEHSLDPMNVFKEAKRVLKDGGFFCVGVPDAARYYEMYFYDFYWFIMREHIQHFDIEHLKLLAEKARFELVNFSKSENPMMSETMILPNLSAVFRSTNREIITVRKEDCLKLQSNIEKCIADDIIRLRQRRALFEQIRRSQKQIYIWGIGREFLYLYEQVGLKHFSIAAFIDSNPYKQNHLTLGKRRISNPSVLKDASNDSALLITAIAHKDDIKKSLSSIGYKGSIIDL